LVYAGLEGFAGATLYTGKELDEETGLYYYGARYYDPRTSVWQSADPILEKYLPTGDKEKDSQLPGMGGVFNSQTLGMYGYASLNPMFFIDPDGNHIESIKNGIASGKDVVTNFDPGLVRPKMKSVQAIVLHRTVSSSSSSAINAAIKSGGKTGFHIVIDKDGTTTQIVNFDNRANHVGKPKTSVTNFNSLGIEVVGRYNEKTETWDPLTSDQIEATAQAVNQIMKEYKLDINKVVTHEDASRKTAGEGQVVWDAIKARVQELSKPQVSPAPQGQ
jgi:RHS repeat-associated protein